MSWRSVSLERYSGGTSCCQGLHCRCLLQNTLLVPEEYSVIATLNLNGDYISDQLAAMVGGIGIAPGANINYRTGHAILRPLMARLPILPEKTL